MKTSLIVADSFYADPDFVRRCALERDYRASTAHYKGVRSDYDSLDEWKKIETLLGRNAVDRYSTFQKTTHADPIVYHSDHQQWAGAVYLDPYRIDAGTSFWRSRSTGLRRPTDSQLVNSVMYSEYNLLHREGWELVDRIGSVYNRLVLWDAQLVHSASSYEFFTEERPRLALLFFFNTK